MNVLAYENVDRVVYRVIGSAMANILSPAFLNAEYQGNKVGGERLARRVEKIHKLEDFGKLEEK